MENVHISLFRSLSVGSFKEHRLAFQMSAPAPFANDAELVDHEKKADEKLKSPELSVVEETEIRLIAGRALNTPGRGPAVATEITNRLAARQAAKDKLTKLSDDNKTARTAIETDIKSVDPVKKATAVAKGKTEIASAQKVIDDFAKVGSDEFKLHTRNAMIMESRIHLEEIIKLGAANGVDFTAKENPVAAETGADAASRTKLGKELLKSIDGGKDIPTGTEFDKDGVKAKYNVDAAGKWAVDDASVAPAGAAYDAATHKFKTADATVAEFQGDANKAKKAAAEQHNAIVDMLANIKDPAVAADVAKVVKAVADNQKASLEKAGVAGRQKSVDDHKKFTDVDIEVPLQKLKNAVGEGAKNAAKEEVKTVAINRKKDIWKNMQDVAKLLAPNVADHLKLLESQIVDVDKLIFTHTGGPTPSETFARVAPTTGPTGTTPPARVDTAPVAPPATAESQARIDKVNVTKTSTDIYDAVNADAAKKTDLPAVTTALKTLTDSADYKALTTPAERTAVAEKLLAALKALDTSKRTTLFATKRITVDESKADKPMTIVDAAARVVPVGPGAGPEVTESNMMKVLKEILDFLKNFLLPALKEGNAATLKQIREDNARLVAEIAKIRPGAAPLAPGQIPPGVRPFYVNGRPSPALFQAQIDRNNVVLRRFDDINRDLSPFQTVLREDGTMLVNNPDNVAFVTRTLDGRRMICRRRLAARPTGPVVVKVDVVNNTYNITNVQGNAVVQNGDRPRAVTNQEATVNRPAVRPTPAAAPRPVVVPRVEAPATVVPPTVVAPPTIVAPPVVVPPPVIVPPTVVPPTARPSGTLGGTGSLLPEPK